MSFSKNRNVDTKDVHNEYLERAESVVTGPAIQRPVYAIAKPYRFPEVGPRRRQQPSQLNRTDDVDYSKEFRYTKNATFVDTLLEFRFQYMNWFHSWTITLPLENNVLSKDTVQKGWNKAQSIVAFTMDIQLEYRDDLQFLMNHPEHPEYSNYMEAVKMGFAIDECSKLVLLTRYPEKPTFGHTIEYLKNETYLEYRYNRLKLFVYRDMYPDDKKVGYRQESPLQ